MGYALTIKSVRRVEPYLTAMAQANASLQWKVPDAKKLAYYIQEGMTAAKELKIEPYGSLRERWKIKFKLTTVTAEYIVSDIPSYLTFTDLHDALDVIEVIIRHKSMSFDLLFPNADPNNEMIKEYCKEHDYTIEVQPEGILIRANLQPE